MSKLKNIISSKLPLWKRAFISKMGSMLLPPRLQRWKKSSLWEKWKSKSNQEIFEEIYTKKIWGNTFDDKHPFYSGPGSHMDNIINPYINEVQKFLKAFKKRPVIVDLGCGDFNIGQNFVRFSSKYIGCDVVEPLINFNKSKFKQKNLEFKKIDITNDNLPIGDVVIVRQVFQHLSNLQIQKVIEKIITSYDYLILTEHLPKKKNFIPNVDIPPGPFVRTDINSGLNIEVKPFRFCFKSKNIVSEIFHHHDRFQTTIYHI